MGTTLHVTLEHGAGRAAALRASELAIQALQDTAARLSTWRADSELSHLNITPVDTPFTLSAELSDDLAAARYWHQLTDGAFDPAIGQLLRAWDLRGDGRWPTEQEHAVARQHSGLRHLQLTGRLAIRRRDLLIDAGAFGKGLGLDAARAAARAAGAIAVRLDAGGQLCWAVDDPRDPRHQDLLIAAVADPRGRQLPVVAQLRLPAAGSLATSGNGERARVLDDGRRIGHLLDPRSGNPAPDWGSVTVLAPSATAADCLATGWFVLGADAAHRAAAGADRVDVLTVQVRSGAPNAAPIVRAGPALGARLTTPSADARWSVHR